MLLPYYVFEEISRGISREEFKRLPIRTKIKYLKKHRYSNYWNYSSILNLKNYIKKNQIKRRKITVSTISPRLKDMAGNDLVINTDFGYDIPNENCRFNIIELKQPINLEFEEIKSLREWLKEKFREIGKATVTSTKEEIFLSSSSAERIIKNRTKNVKLVYQKIKDIIELGIYKGFKFSDERHPSVYGQNIYQNILKCKKKLYLVEFAVDIPKMSNVTKKIAGVKIKELNGTAHSK